MSTSWQWFPDSKEAICNYCGFSTIYADDFTGHLEHDCDPAKHAATTARQGLPIGRSPRPEAASRIPLDQLFACIHRGSEIRRERCRTCPGETWVKVHACQLHGECSLSAALSGVKFCGGCGDVKLPAG